MKLWESVPSRDERQRRSRLRREALALRRAAEPLVEETIRACASKAEVVAALEKQDMADDLQRSAIRLAKFKADRPRRLRLDCWGVVKRPGAKASAYELALDRARLQVRIPGYAQDRGLDLLALGLAQYRVGKAQLLREAVDTLESAGNELGMSIDAGSYLRRPCAYAAQAMALCELGQYEEARAALERARELMEAFEAIADHRHYPQRDALAIFDEARMLLQVDDTRTASP